MTNNANDIEDVAVEMIKRFRHAATQIGRELAEIAEERHHDMLSAQTWRDIADAIERLITKV